MTVPPAPRNPACMQQASRCRVHARAHGDGRASTADARQSGRRRHVAFRPSGFLHRPQTVRPRPHHVRDELEVLARNQAAEMHADTIKPLGEPVDGSQPWGAYQCGSRMINPSRNGSSAPKNAAPAPGNAQTFPRVGATDGERLATLRVPRCLATTANVGGR
ncbi:MAG: hypothetical protein WDW36_008827 [Sanguina aurantia]